MIFDTLQYTDAGGSQQEIALALANVAGVPASNKTIFTPRSHAPSEFEISWAQPPETGIAIPFKSQCIVWIGRTSTAGASNTFSGGTMLFQGRRWDNEGSTSASGNFTRIVLFDALKDLEKIALAFPWNYIASGTLAAPVYGQFNYVDVPLFQAWPTTRYSPPAVISITSDAVLGSISTWQQIQEIIYYATHFASGADAVQLQLAGMGTFTPDVQSGVTLISGAWTAGTPEFTPTYCNIYTVRAEKCLRALLYCLRPHPAVFTEMDFSTSPPTLHFRDRSAMTAITLPYKFTDGNGVAHLASDIKSLDELQPDNVRIYYKINSTINEQPCVSFTSDCYPNATNKLLSLDYSVDITGDSQTETIYNFTSFAFSPASLALWRMKTNSLKQIAEGGQIPNDGDDGALALLDTTINGSLSMHPDGLQVRDETGVAIDLSVFQYYTDMDVFAWMQMADGSGAARLAAANVTGFFSYHKKTGAALKLTPKVPRHSHSMRLKLTNAPSGRYILKQTVAGGEVRPANLAQTIYNELSVLQWKLRHKIIQTAASATALPTLIKPGKHKINLSGGNAAWTTMNAVPENVSIELFRVWVNKNDGSGNDCRLAAKHSINCGPVNHLEPGYLVQLANMFINRLRAKIDPQQRLTGGTASNKVDLTGEAARENSVPANAEFSEHFVYGDDVDGSHTNLISHDAEAGQMFIGQLNKSDGSLA